jgi:hypothetical protein
MLVQAALGTCIVQLFQFFDAALLVQLKVISDGVFRDANQFSDLTVQ